MILWSIIQLITFPEGTNIQGPLPGILATPIGSYVTSILQSIVLPAAAVATFVMLVFSAYQFITSTGDPKAVDQARMRIWMSLLGFLIVAFSWFLLRLLEELTLPGPARIT